MRFYVEFLGFNDDVRIKEIYPTSNSFDIGISDLYTMEPRYDNISFQCDFDQNIFKYFPSTNNSGHQLFCDLRWWVEKVYVDGNSFAENDEIWIEGERCRIASGPNAIGDLYWYYIERGINGSIAVDHIVGNWRIRDISGTRGNLLSNIIKPVYATTKKLTPINVVCKFYQTDNIGNFVKTLGYGKIKNVTLSNSKLITVDCENLYKQLESDIIIPYYNYDEDNEPALLNEYPSNFTLVEDKAYIRTGILLNNVTVSVSNNDSSTLTTYTSYQYKNEILSLLSFNNKMRYDVLIECEKVRETSDYRKLNLGNFMKMVLSINSVIIKFNETYSFFSLTTKSIIEDAPTEVFMSSYFNINDFNINANTFEKVSSANIKFKVVVQPDNTGNYEFQEGEITLVDDIMCSIGDKTIDMDLTKFLIYDKKYSKVNNEDDIYRIGLFGLYNDVASGEESEGWMKFVFEINRNSIQNNSRTFTYVYADYYNEIFSFTYLNQITLDDIVNTVKSRLYYMNNCTDVIEINTTKWYKRFELGKKYKFSDSHIIKTLSDTGVIPDYTCIGYENGVVRFLSSDPWTPSLVSFYKEMKWNVSLSKWTLEIPRYIEGDTSTIDTISTNDVLSMYKYNTSTYVITESNETITDVSWNDTYKLYTFNVTGLTYNEDYLHMATYKRGVTPSSTKYQNFLYETFGQI